MTINRLIVGKCWSHSLKQNTEEWAHVDRELEMMSSVFRMLNLTHWGRQSHRDVCTHFRPEQDSFFRDFCVTFYLSQKLVCVKSEGRMVISGNAVLYNAVPPGKVLG